MKGIVERLRANSASQWLAGMYRHINGERFSVKDDCAEAADEIERLRKIVWEQVYQVHLTDRPDFYPCLLCGYNGPGFWQPDKHPCAAMERASFRETPSHE